jgi:hypothetical protein
MARGNGLHRGNAAVTKFPVVLPSGPAKVLPHLAPIFAPMFRKSALHLAQRKAIDLAAVDFLQYRTESQWSNGAIGQKPSRIGSPRKRTRVYGIEKRAPH